MSMFLINEHIEITMPPSEVSRPCRFHNSTGGASDVGAYYINDNPDIRQQFLDFFGSFEEEWWVDSSKFRKYVNFIKANIFSKRDLFVNNMDSIAPAKTMFARNDVQIERMFISGQTGRYLSFDNDNDICRTFRESLFEGVSILVIEKRDNRIWIYPDIRKDVFEQLRIAVLDISIEAVAQDYLETPKAFVVVTDNREINLSQFEDVVNEEVAAFDGDKWDCIRLLGVKYGDKFPANTVKDIINNVFGSDNASEEYRKGAKLGKYVFPKSLFRKYDPNNSDSNSQKPVGPVVTGAINHVVYGVPGCGKSHYVDKELLNDLEKDSNGNYIHVVRTTFYQDYTYTDFIGQILPIITKNDSGEEQVTYDFKAGPFTLALLDALTNKDKKCALIIEELNRGNAPSIFGEIFQLMDRNEKGESKYSITNPNISKFFHDKGVPGFEDESTIKSCPIKIPGNLWIYATMNTSDQNVFTLDTAFKRRWKFEKLDNSFDGHPYGNYYVPGMSDKITWEKLVKDVNDFIVNDKDGLNNEDKQIGAFFIEERQLINCSSYREGTEQEKKDFAYKFFEYLWDDVAKFSRQKWFNNYATLDKLIAAYLTEGENVFNAGVIK